MIYLMQIIRRPHLAIAAAIYEPIRLEMTPGRPNHTWLRATESNVDHYTSVLPMPTQPPTLGGMGYENQPKCGDVRRLEIKADMALSTCV